MIEEIRILVDVEKDSDERYSKHFSTLKQADAIEKAIEALNKLKEQPIKKRM